MFPFQGELTDDLTKATANNSNFDCTCKNNTSVNATIDRNNVFRYDYNLDNDKYGTDADNLINKSYNINVIFDYNSVHDFHKLIRKNQDRNASKTFSVCHTNIESLMHNFNSVHDLLLELEADFEIVAVSETRNPIQKEHNFRAGVLNGYHKYIGQPGTSMKSGSGLYIKENIKFKERKDLNISFHDDNNEFQTKWVEISNQNILMS